MVRYTAVTNLGTTLLRASQQNIHDSEESPTGMKVDKKQEKAVENN